MKTTKIHILLILFLSSFAGAMAQSNAEDYLNKVVEQLQQAKGITAEFTLQGEAGSGLYMQGSLKMQGKKFYLETNDLTTWYDGKTMWSYAPAIGEVNITTPTLRELAEINPYCMLDNCKQSFSVKELASDIKGERRFLLTPTKRNTSIAQVILTIATSTQAPISFEITGNNSGTVLVAVTQYNDKASLPPITFTFDAHRYPQANIVDLR